MSKFDEIVWTLRNESNFKSHLKIIQKQWETKENFVYFLKIM